METTPETKNDVNGAGRAPVGVALEGLARQVEKPVKCCRCKHVHGEDDRARKQDHKSPIISFTMICPKCGAHSFYMLRADGKIARNSEEWAATLALRWPRPEAESEYENQRLS